MPLDMADAAAQAKELRTLLRDAQPQPLTPLSLMIGRPVEFNSEKAHALLSKMGIQLGDKVVIAGQKVNLFIFTNTAQGEKKQNTETV